MGRAGAPGNFIPSSK